MRTSPPKALKKQVVNVDISTPPVWIAITWETIV